MRARRIFLIGILSLLVWTLSAFPAEEPAAPAPPAAPASPEEARSIEARTEAAEVVFSGRIESVDPARLTAECKVETLLKGALPSFRVRVRYRRVFDGQKPEAGVSALFFVRRLEVVGRRPKVQVAEFIGPFDGLAAATEGNVHRVKLTVAGRPADVEPGEEAPTPPAPDPDSLEGLALAADAAVIARVESVVQPPAAPERALLRVRVEEVLKGARLPGPPRKGEELGVRLTLPGETPYVLKPNPVRGRTYLLFLRRDAQTALYAVLRRGRGLVELADEATRADVRARLATVLPLAATSAAPAEVGSVEGTLRAWERAWNAKDMAACIGCYSRANVFRRAWDEKNEPVYGKMAEDLRTFPGRVELLDVTVRRLATEDARVVGQIAVEAPGARRQVHPLKMLLRREGGAWLIVDDGFSRAP